MTKLKEELDTNETVESTVESQAQLIYSLAEHAILTGGQKGYDKLIDYLDNLVVRNGLGCAGEVLCWVICDLVIRAVKEKDDKKK